MTSGTTNGVDDELTTDVVGNLRPTPAPAHRVVELALRAPSVHNTQPWLWRITDDTIELHADRSRQLHVADPSGRNLTISCGAALHHARVAAAALGWPADVVRLPDPRNPDHLATLVLRPGFPTPRSEADLAALARRRTDRRRFTSWPVPPERLAHLAAAAQAPDITVVPITDVSDRFRVELLASRATALEQSDRRYAEEQAAWVGRSATDGVPEDALPRSDGHRPMHTSRFALSGSAEEPLDVSDGLVAICTADEGPDAWLRSGELLCRVWVQAMEEGLSLVPLSQVIEVEETRIALQHEILGGVVHPQMLVRIGWQEIARSPQPPTPRRPLADVLLA